MSTRYSTLSTALFTVLSGFAQPTLQQGNMTPMVGNTAIYRYSTYQSPGAPGPNQTWDFSTVAITETHSLLFVAAGATPNGSNFPSATYAVEIDAPSGYYSYAQLSSSGGYGLGTDLGAVGSSTLSNLARTWNSPLALNGTWGDTFVGNFVSIGGGGTIDGSVSGQADGYGSLVLPYGTVTNVLRVRLNTVTTQTITTPSTVISTVTEEAYQYFKPGVSVPIAITAQSTNVVTPGGTSTNSSFQYLDESSIGMRDAETQSLGIALYPNPVIQEMSVVFSAPGNMILSIHNAIGQVVRTEPISNEQPGVASRPVDVSELPSGLYMLRITGEGGQTGSRAFVKQ
ncbi:MAG: T9SS type A sorting domain-containing protein [Flavobacteriales bacterium]|nr:T9SS type A sorting domain-containing protein [Flavobacteriales bacterium]